MQSIKINFANNTIEVAKSYLKKGSIYGTKEYNTIQEAKRENPGFIIKVVETKSKRSSQKGLTHDIMRNYIKNHDTEGTKLEEFELRLAGMTVEGLPCGNYIGAIKSWFLKEFPEVKTFYTTKTVA